MSFCQPMDELVHFAILVDLKSHDLTVTEINNMNNYTYLWSEHKVRKGSCEVSIAVLRFLKKKNNSKNKYIYYIYICNRMIKIVWSLLAAQCFELLKIRKNRLVFLVPRHGPAHSVIKEHCKDHFICNSKSVGIKSSTSI